MEVNLGDELTGLLAGSLVIVMKLVVIVVAYKTIKLGYDLLLRGVKGEFKFKSSISGLKADLQSASPGLLFVVVGCIMVVAALVQKFPQEFDTTEKTSSIDMSGLQNLGNTQLPKLAPVTISEDDYEI